jgi:glycosyltransferase involved in cell wall biosynthesis
MIGTPALEGTLDVLYVNSLVQSIKSLLLKDIEIFPVFLANESMLPIARNDLLHYAYEGEVDNIVFIDADQEWLPGQLLRLLNHNVDLVAGTCRKKSQIEQYAARIFDNQSKLFPDENGLCKMQGVGTGFCSLSKNCIKQLYETSSIYNKERRNVFEYQIINGEWIGEDLIMCKKWIDLGGVVYLDTEITVNHIGKTNYIGNFKEWAIKNNIIE